MNQLDTLIMDLVALEEEVRSYQRMKEEEFYKGVNKENKEMKENYRMIEITLDSGTSAIWDSNEEEWDDYEYRDFLFIVKKKNSWVGIYNMNNVVSIVVK